MAGGATASAQDIIPADRRIDWTQAGVPNLEGIRTSRFVFTNMVGLDTNGVRDCQPAIQAALNVCPSNGIVRLPAGRLVISNALSVHRNLAYDGGWKTLMGAGMNLTTLIRKGSGGTAFATGIEGLRGASNRIVYSSLYQGSSNLALFSVVNISVGDILVLARQDEGATNFNLVFANAYLTNDNIVTLDGNLTGNGAWYRTASGDVFQQYVRCTGINGTNITIWPPLYYSWTNEPNLYAHCKSIYGTANLVGIESMTITNAVNQRQLLYFAGAYGCWLKGVKVLGAGDSLVYFSETLNCEIRDSDFSNDRTNSAALCCGDITALTLSGVSASKVENNSFSGFWSQIMMNSCSSGNAITYNYFTNQLHFQSIGGGLSQPDLFINHLPHNMMNLVEGNVMAGFHADNYHGSSSHNTLFRNWIHGMNRSFGFNLENHIRCIDLCRYSYYYNIVGNILGSVEAARPGALYQALTSSPLNSGIPLIYRLGYPNTGNDCPTCGSVFIYYRGQTGTGVNGFPIGYDERVTNTLIRVHNYDYVTRTIPDGIGNLPNSLIYDSAPPWWGSRPWPPFDPGTPASASAASIPAGFRYYLRVKNVRATGP